MSDKTSYEDKSAVAPAPRELTRLIEVTQQLVEATRLRAKERAASLSAEAGQAWSQVNSLQLHAGAAGGYPPTFFEACADALNAAMDARGEASRLSNSLGSF